MEEESRKLADSLSRSLGTNNNPSINRFLTSQSFDLLIIFHLLFFQPLSLREFI